MYEEIFSDSDCSLLESATWSSLHGRFYCVSINHDRIYSMKPDGSGLIVYNVERYPSKIFYITINHLVYAALGGVYSLDLLNNSSIQKISIPLKHGLRFNDGLYLNESGQFLLGEKTISDIRNNDGKVNLFSENSDPFVVMSGLSIPNGMVLSPDKEYIYFAESDHHRVYKIPFHQFMKGDLDFRDYDSICFSDNVYPDGIALDQYGRLCVAEWGGCAVSIWNTDSLQLLDKIDLPYQCISSCAIGRIEEQHKLFITSASSTNLQNCFSRVLVVDI